MAFCTKIVLSLNARSYLGKTPASCLILCLMERLTLPVGYSLFMEPMAVLPLCQERQVPPRGRLMWRSWTSGGSLKAPEEHLNNTSGLCQKTGSIVQKLPKSVRMSSEGSKACAKLNTAKWVGSSSLRPRPPGFKWARSAAGHTLLTLQEWEGSLGIPSCWSLFGTGLVGQEMVSKSFG